MHQDIKDRVVVMLDQKWEEKKQAAERKESGKTIILTWKNGSQHAIVVLARDEASILKIWL